MKKYDYHLILKSPDRITRFIDEKISDKINWYYENREHILENYAESPWKTKVKEIFYRDHLNLNVAESGHIILVTEDVLIIDWENDCPILQRCLDQNIDSVSVCSLLYSMQYQALLSLIEPGLFFYRDYNKIRPHHHACREIIYYNKQYADMLNQHSVYLCEGSKSARSDLRPSQG